jgi:imidazolonepropionase-like amidohydrolase
LRIPGVRIVRSSLALVAACLAGCAASPASRAPQPEPWDLLITSATVIDVRSGARLEDRSIAIDDGLIVAITDGVPSHPARARFDARGRYAIPGLWDMHVHFGGGAALIDENRALLPLHLAHGITSVRDAAGDLSDSVLRWRDEVAQGTLEGPTIYTSGPKLEGKDSIWPGDLEITDEAELAAALDRLQAMRVDFVKITDNTLSPELFLAALRETERRGLTSSAHVPLALPIREVVDAGLDSIEHMGYALKAASAREAEISADYAARRVDYVGAMNRYADSIDREIARRAFGHVAARGTAIVPTLHGSRVVAFLDQDDHRDDEYLNYLGPGLKATYAWRVQRAAQDDAAAIAARHRRQERSEALLPWLRDAGVTILAGTDAGFLNSFNYPGPALHEELALFVRNGLTPLDALQAATLRGAAFLGHAGEAGELQPGQRADVLLLEADPLADIAATRAIAAVVARGRLYDRAALDRLLQEAREAVAKAESGAPP